MESGPSGQGLPRGKAQAVGKLAAMRRSDSTLGKTRQPYSARMEPCGKKHAKMKLFGKACARMQLPGKKHARIQRAGEARAQMRLLGKGSAQMGFSGKEGAHMSLIGKFTGAVRADDAPRHGLSASIE